MYCTNCGRDIPSSAAFCPYCGTATGSQANQAAPNRPPLNPVIDGVQRYDWLTTLLLCFFLGTFGVHSFYTKKTAIGVIQLLTFGGFGIWYLIDLIMIITETYRDGNDNPLVRR
jgi:TM2 domain-containing membrane protein YozV